MWNARLFENTKPQTELQSLLHNMREIAIVSVVFACSLLVCNCHFLGGTIHWMKENASALRFTYRLSWEKGSGPCRPSCSTTQIGKSVKFSPGSNLSFLQWNYTDGNTTSTLSDISYYLTSVSDSSVLGWEQGENSFQFSGFTKNSTYTVYLDSIPWIPAVPGGNVASGYMETIVDLRHRSDTGNSNNSPYVSVQPFIGAAYGCTAKVRIPVEDPDGDIVRCRWAKTSECGAGCTNTPLNAVRLSKAGCSLTINAFNETGFLEDSTYRLALVVEDFPHGAIDVGGQTFTRDKPMSKIPLQLTLRTTPAGVACPSHNFTFVTPTPPDGFRYFTTPANLQRIILSRSFFLQTNDTNSTEFMVSTPRFLIYSVRPNYHLNRSDVIHLTTIWRPKLSQTGDQQICVWGLQANGITTDSRCVTDIVSDTSNCHQGTCHNNGTCMNLFNVTNDICQCPKGFKPPFCLNETVCSDVPCANNGTCSIQGTTPLKYSCSCTAGYQGSNCEEDVNHCPQRPCKNKATCIDLQDRYLCLCSNNFTGSNCETDTNGNAKGAAADHGVPPWIPTTATVGGLITIAGIAAIVYKLKSSIFTSSASNKSTTKSNLINVKPLNST